MMLFGKNTATLNKEANIILVHLQYINCNQSNYTKDMCDFLSLLDVNIC